MKYRPGVVNIDADILSRAPHNQMDGEISADSVATVCHSLQTGVVSLVESLCKTEQEVEPVDDDLVQETRELRRAQREDEAVGEVIRMITSGYKGPIKNVAVRPYLREQSRLKMRRGILCREVVIDGEARYRTVVPKKMREIVLESMHNHMGHPGKDRTLHLLRERYYWPLMPDDVQSWVSRCDRCLRRKSSTAQRAPMVSIRTTQPFEFVSMDYMTLEASKGGFANLLVITDHFTKFAVAVPTRNQTAKTTADAFYHHWAVYFGFPERLHTDQGANFESQIIREVCKLTNTLKSRTSPYHPSGNGLTERMNRTLLDMLGTLDPDQKCDWKSQIDVLTHAYNCTRHESTGYSPYFLLFRLNPRLPIDLILGRGQKREATTYCEYATKLKERLKKGYEQAVKHSDKARQKQKTVYDQRVRSAALESGDRVLVKKLAFEGKHKIDDRWENPVYIVVDQPNPDITVYRVCQEEDEKGVYRTLHRNHLLAIGSLPVDESSETPKIGGGEKDEPEDVSEMSDDGTNDEVDHFPSLAGSGDVNGSRTDDTVVGSGDVNGSRIDDTVVGKCDDSSGMEMVQTNETNEMVSDDTGVDPETNEMVSVETGDDSEMIEVVPKDDGIEENEMVDDAIEGDVPLLEWKYPGEPEVNEVPEDPKPQDVDGSDSESDSKDGEVETVPSLDAVPNPDVRRSTRMRRPPAKLRDGTYQTMAHQIILHNSSLYVQ